MHTDPKLGQLNKKAVFHSVEGDTTHHTSPLWAGTKIGTTAKNTIVYTPSSHPPPKYWWRRGAAIAQWIRLRFPSCRPRFETQAHKQIIPLVHLLSSRSTSSFPTAFWLCLSLHKCLSLDTPFSSCSCSPILNEWIVSSGTGCVAKLAEALLSKHTVTLLNSSRYTWSCSVLSATPASPNIYFSINKFVS